MASVELLFTAPPATGQPVQLVFGGGDTGSAVENVTLSADASLPELEGAGYLRAGVRVSADAQLPELESAGSINYDSRTERPGVRRVAAPWQDAADIETPTQAGWQESLPALRRVATPFQEAASVQHSMQTLFQEADRFARRYTAAWEEAESVETNRLFAWQDGVRVRRRAADLQQEADRLRVSAEIRWEDGIKIRNTYASKWEEAGRVARLLHEVSGYGRPVSKRRDTVRQEAMRPKPGRSPSGTVQPPVQDPCYIPPPGNAVELLFAAPWTNSTELIFVCERHAPPPEPGGTATIPVQRVYIVENEVTLTRADNGLNILATDVSLSLDVSSWTWSFNATVPPYYFDDVQRSDPTTPVELIVAINGHSVRVIVEDISRDRTWDSSFLKLGGRGVSGLLASPFAPVMNFAQGQARTMSQLAQDVLTFNGAPIGWGTDWKLADWSVPAGVFNEQGTYMDALNVLASAAGGYVQPHPTDRLVRFLKKYPVLPWNWPTATPDFILPSDAVTVEGIGWSTKPVYTRVIVTGMQGGVKVDATRAGSNGLLLAPGVTDALITNVEGGRARAESILADVGNQAAVRLRTPIFPDSGLILPGSMLRYVDGDVERVGVTRSVSVEGSQAESWQTIEVETRA